MDASNIENLPTLPLTGFLSLGATQSGGGISAAQQTTPGQTITTRLDVTSDPHSRRFVLIQVSDDGKVWQFADLTPGPNTSSDAAQATAQCDTHNYEVTFTAKSFARLHWPAVGVNSDSFSFKVVSSVG